MLRRTFLRFGAAALAAVLIPMRALGWTGPRTLTWTGQVSCDLDNPLNWSPQRLPRDGDSVVFGPAPYPATGTGLDMTALSLREVTVLPGATVGRAGNPLPIS